MNIFIAGISYNLSNADLGELFEEFGEVISAKIVMDREYFFSMIFFHYIFL